MAARLEKVFMIIRTLKLKIRQSRITTAFIALALLSCSEDQSDDAIPYQPFSDIVINLDLPEYVALRSDGNSVYNNDGGVRGIIIHRVNANTFYAFERNCSYHPNDACATVGIDGSNLYLSDSCCGSMFNFNGEPIGGPAWRPLRRYQTYANGSQLRITDEIAN
jgi:hypothetical protein